MNAATKRPTVDALLHTVEELDALPPFSIVLADPEGRSQCPDDRRLAMQKRPGEPGYTDFWYPAWDSDLWNALASEEAVGRFKLGPFLVVWTPAAGISAEDAA